MKLRLTALLTAAALLMLSCGCAAEEKHSAAFTAMDTVMNITVVGGRHEAALAAAEAEVRRLEALFSVTLPDSEIYKLNLTGRAELSEDTADVIEEALAVWRDTGGNFDITISPAVDAWGFYSNEYTVPAPDELERLKELTDSGRISLAGREITLGEGQRIDLGGIAKGYASKKVYDILRGFGINSGIIALGGNIQLFGLRPDGKPWTTGIRSPDSADRLIGKISATDISIVTSGSYQRYFERDGVRFHHIFDPASARPADSDLVSVTVVCTDPSLADGLSTALFVMGCRDAVSYWQRTGGFELVLYTDDGRLLVTAGLENCFSSDLDHEIIDIDTVLR